MIHQPQISGNTPVHIVFVLRDGRRGFFVRAERREHPRTKQVHTHPIVDDDASLSTPVPYEFALIAQQRFRELGWNCRLAREQNGEFIDEALEAEGKRWPEEDHFCPITSDGLTGYLVKFVRSPAGRQWCLKFRNPDLAAQSVFVAYELGPEAAVAKARECGRLSFELPYPHPFAEDIRAAKQADEQHARQAEHIRTHGRPRPGNNN